jgi:hypothetical protein
MIQWHKEIGQNDNDLQNISQKLTNEQYVSHALKTGVTERFAVPVPLATPDVLLSKDTMII